MAHSIVRVRSGLESHLQSARPGSDRVRDRSRRAPISLHEENQIRGSPLDYQEGDESNGAQSDGDRDAATTARVAARARESIVSERRVFVQIRSSLQGFAAYQFAAKWIQFVTVKYRVVDGHVV